MFVCLGKYVSRRDGESETRQIIKGTKDVFEFINQIDSNFKFCFIITLFVLKYKIKCFTIKTSKN